MTKKLIPKDKYGLFEDDGTMYADLPVYVIDEDDGTEDIVDEENWQEWLSDLNKSRYKYYRKGGENGTNNRNRW